MKRTIAFTGAIALVLVLVAGCASAPPAKEKSAEPAAVATPGAAMEAPSFKIIENQNSALGGQIPFWVAMDTGALEQDSRFKDNYVFKIEQTGASLSGVKVLANNLDAPSEIARLVNMRVQQKFAGAQVGDQNAVSQYFENVVKTLADVTVSGFRKYGEFWVLKQYFDNGSPGKKEYSYYVLYTIPRTKVDDLIKSAIDQTQPQSDAQKTAKERVRQIFEGGL
ncbi:MAG TPA: hypothetical protein VMW73_06615 [Spirochaetia bacterium]|nr:hypothetical protein [Spirochaetia bacterium]